MTIDSLTHVTLNSGHSRLTYPFEVSKDLYFSLRRIVKESMRPKGAALFDGYTVKTSKLENGAIATVFASDGMPVLTTLCLLSNTGDSWAALHSSFQGKLATSPDKPPAGSYVADRLEIGSLGHPDALTWTGDFSRCFAWTILAPSQIR